MFMLSLKMNISDIVINIKKVVIEDNEGIGHGFA
jgi:hypothetical protein